MSSTSKPRYLTAKQHKKNPILAGHLERLADLSIERHHKAVGATVEQFKARRTAVHADNRGLTPQMLSVWRTEIVPKLPPNANEIIRKEMLAEQHFGGATNLRSELIAAVARILEREPRLLEEKKMLGLRTTRKDPHAMATELVSGVIQARADALHDKTTLKPELASLRSAAITRNQARAIVAANAKKIFDIAHTKQTSKKRQALQDIIKKIQDELEAKLQKGHYWSSLPGSGPSNWAKENLPAEFIPIVLRILSKQPEEMHEPEFAQYNYQVLVAAFEYYGVPLTQPPKPKK